MLKSSVNFIVESDRYDVNACICAIKFTLALVACFFFLEMKQGQKFEFFHNPGRISQFHESESPIIMR